MKIRNKVIICLAVIGIILFGTVHGYIIPQNNIKKQQYILDQQNPSTHDLNSILKFKNKYMGNASNLINLFHTLPLSTVEMSFQLFPDKLTLEVNYKETVWNIGEYKVNQALIYDSTAAFALIGNLEAINYNFIGSAYKVLRSDLSKWYGSDLLDLIIKAKWKSSVQDKLEDSNYINNCVKAVLIRQ